MRKTGLLLPFQISRITVFGRDAKKKKERREKNFKGKSVTGKSIF